PPDTRIEACVTEIEELRKKSEQVPRTTVDCLLAQSRSPKSAQLARTLQRPQAEVRKRSQFLSFFGKWGDDRLPRALQRRLTRGLTAGASVEQRVDHAEDLADPTLLEEALEHGRRELCVGEHVRLRPAMVEGDRAQLADRRESVLVPPQRGEQHLREVEDGP